MSCSNGILECRGRIVGAYPIYLPRRQLVHLQVCSASSSCDPSWGSCTHYDQSSRNPLDPCLRRLVKKVIRNCWGYKRFQAQAYKSPPSGHLPSTRTQEVTPYVRADFAGPIKYGVRQKTEGKAYLALYACGLTGGGGGGCTSIYFQA